MIGKTLSRFVVGLAVAAAVPTIGTAQTALNLRLGRLRPKTRHGQLPCAPWARRGRRPPAPASA
jgi:hypothetical protein